MTDWGDLTKRTLAGLDACDPIYRPTSFWGPGVRSLLADLESGGLERFKSWPTAKSWFFPLYGNGFTSDAIDRMYAYAATLNPGVQEAWFRTSLAGAYQARRDFDAVRLAWDQARWPFDIERLGESEVGLPPQLFPLSDGNRSIGWTRPYLNYLLCLAALSRHVDAPPSSFLEIGGGYGVLGEIVMSRDPDARYVDVDIAPLLTVASYYLDALFPGRVAVYDDSIADSGPIERSGSAVMPNWRIGDLAGPFDVFVNSFSFQEMEPPVVERYVADIAALGVTYVVSLNSRAGKPKLGRGRSVGVADPVTSERIAAMFAAGGYELLAQYGDPLIQSSGELLVMRHAGVTSRPPATLAEGSAPRLTDYRAAPRSGQASALVQPPSGSLARLARDWLPPRLLRAFRAARRRRR